MNYDVLVKRNLEDDWSRIPVSSWNEANQVLASVRSSGFPLSTIREPEPRNGIAIAETPQAALAALENDVKFGA